MAFGSLLRRSIQLSAITIICLIIFVVSYALLLPAPPNDANQSGGESMLIIVTALNVAVMGWLILRAYEQGIRLAAPLALAFYMVQTFMPQLEALIFPAFAQHLPPGMLGGMLLAGLVHSLLWIPLAVLILGKWPRTSETQPAREASPRIQGWVWRLPLAIIAYVMVYFVFGYYIAWRNPAVAAEACAVAWEGAGGARAARFNQLPFLELRAITDTADHHAPDAFARNLSQAMMNLATLIMLWRDQRRG